MEYYVFTLFELKEIEVYASILWKLNFRELRNRLVKVLRNSSCKNLVKNPKWHKSLKWSKNLLILPHQMGPRSILPSVLLVSENYQWLWETVFGQVETDFMAHNSCQQKKEVWAVLIELLTLELTITLLVEWHLRGVRCFSSFVQICYWISYNSSLSRGENWQIFCNLLKACSEGKQSKRRSGLHHLK